MSRHRGHRAEPGQPRGDRLQHRQAVPARRAGRDQRPGRPASDTSGSSRASSPRMTAARPANRDRHACAVDAGTSRRPPPGAAAHGRATARPAAAACAASISTVMITAAPYLRRDHRSAGSSTCVRPQPRHRDLRGQNSSQPEPIATSRRRACPHRASRPPQYGHRSKPAVSRDSTLSAEPRTVTIRCHLRHHRAALPEVLSKITGRAAATTYMATVTPSTTPRIANPPDYTRSAPSTTPGTRATATLNGA